MISNCSAYSSIHRLLLVGASAKEVDALRIDRYIQNQISEEQSEGFRNEQDELLERLFQSGNDGKISKETLIFEYAKITAPERQARLQQRGVDALALVTGNATTEEQLSRPRGAAPPVPKAARQWCSVS
jgi:hypothetical protein